MLDKIERYKQFYKSEKGLLVLTDIQDTGTKTLKLTDYDFSKESEHIRYWDDCITNMEIILNARQNLHDMWVPGITMHYGFGAFGAIYNDHPLTFTEDTSYMHDLDDSWDLSYDKNRFWSQMYIKCAAYISEKANGRYFVTPYPAPCPMDAANLIRESNLFLDIYENEDALTKMLTDATNGIVEHLTLINENTFNSHSGTMAFNRWIPSGCLLLDDAGDLCSPDTYRSFVKPYTQEVLTRMNGGYIHHHSLGKQQYQNISQYDHLYVQQISSDPSEPRPISGLDFCIEQTKGSHVAIDLECTPTEVLDNLETLKNGKFITLVSCKTYDEATAFMDTINSKE